MICPHPLDLVSQGREDPVQKRAIKERKWKGRPSSVRSGNEKDGNGKGWEKSSRI